MLTNDEISEILLPLMPLKDPYVFARAVEAAVLARGRLVARDFAVTTWRDVCGSDRAMAMLPPTGRLLEEYATKIAAAVDDRYAPLMQAVEWLLDDGHMNQEHLARLRAAWEAA